MWVRRIALVMMIGLFSGRHISAAQAQSTPSNLKLEQIIRNLLGQSDPQFTPILPDMQSENLSIHILYDAPEIIGKNLSLEVLITRPSPNGITTASTPIMMKTLYFDTLPDNTRVSIVVPEGLPSRYIDAVVRDSNRNIILQAVQPVPINGKHSHTLTLIPLGLGNNVKTDIPDFNAIEIINGKIILPRKVAPEIGSTLFVQLLEDALAGGLSMSLAAEHIIRLDGQTAPIAFTLERGLWDRADEPALTFKAWITNASGRKTFVMNAPVNYSDASIDYDIHLDALKRGKDTKRGLNLDPSLMAQTLVQGEASFEPVNGIPGEARLKIVLKQDRGQYNQNPILSEQTLILRNMETRIPFSLTTDSTHFDPYAPAPFLSISLTDKFGRVYYSSGDVRASEGQNTLRLYPE